MQFGAMDAVQLDATLLRMVRAAMREVRECTSTDVFLKTAYDGTPEGDVATSADHAAQAACESIRQAEMPWAGVIAEEDGLVVEGELIKGVRGYFTFDGMDGTKRYSRGVRNGIASMIGYVHGTTIVAAAVGEVFTDTVYALQAVTGKVVKIAPDGGVQNLSALPRTILLADGDTLARGSFSKHHPLVLKLLEGLPLFTWYKDLSIGMSMAQLWNDDVVLHIQSRGTHTPWDDTPVTAIGQALGMVWLRPDADGQALEVYEPSLVDRVMPRTHGIVMVHRSRLDELAAVVPIVR